MHPLDWTFLDALQAGALVALFASFGADALSRRDRMMAWLALACLLVGLRHGVLAVGVQPALNPDTVDRLQSLLVAGGFFALCEAFASLYPQQVPRAFPLWVGLAMTPNLVRNLFLSRPGTADLLIHHATNLVYLVSCGFVLHWTLRARQSGDPLARRLFFGLILVTLPVVVEVAAFSLFGLKVRLSGISLVILAMAIGTSWQWLVVQVMETRIHRAETEVEAWQSLVPGNAFRTDQPSPLMEARFGPDWAERVKAAPEAPLLGTDGITYHVRSRLLHHQERLGWYAREHDLPTHRRGLLSGWTVALGVDDPLEQARLQGLLQGWGAEVEPWGTIPPREGPYPSVLLWAREPSILAVWREGDLLRRRPRWIQIGGPITEGPHARLEPGGSEDRLRRLLEELLSRR